MDIEVNTQYILFVCFGTISQYGLHRYIGLSRLEDQELNNRFLIIKENKNSILLTVGLSGILSIYFWITMPAYSRILAILPLFLSLLYVVPVFTDNKRLRDFPFIKIFLIALCWSLFSVTIPMMEAGYISSDIALLSLERILFFYAITIPFDIRDYSIDIRNKVPTIPGQIGLQMAKHTASLSSILGALILIYFGVSLVAASILSAVVLLLIYGSSDDRMDLYYTGLVDGTIILYFVLLYFL